MSSSSNKSSVTSNLKPRNIFYVWYTELCRRSNTNPLSMVKPPKPKNDTVLDFVADRIKPEEWTPIVNALSVDTSLHVIAIRSRVAGCYFYHDVNTEEKMRRMKKKCSSLWTDYILRSLTKSLGLCIKNSQVLTCLELEGLPLTIEYLEILLSCLRSNKTIKILSLKHCPINDGGCQLVCTNLRLIPSISVVNLSSCNLSASSGQYISKVIKHQQLNRYCESWHNSLRYEEPENNAMGGIKRITLSNNPNLGDEGAIPILDALDDDLWIKAIDMQNCGITENLSNRLIDLVTQSNSLEVADFRNNDNLTSETIESILEEFERKYSAGLEPEFHWTDTSSMICDRSSYTSRSSVSGMSNFIQKTRSAPLKNSSASEYTLKGGFRRTKTFSNLDKISNLSKFIDKNSQRELIDTKRQLTELHAKLQEEISKRIEIEKINIELRRQLIGIQQLGNLHKDRFLTPEKLTKVVRVIEDLNRSNNGCTFSKHLNSLHKPDSSVKKVSAEKPHRLFDRPKSYSETEQCSKKARDLVINLRPQSSKSNFKIRKSAPNRLKPKCTASVMSPILEVSTPSNPVVEQVNVAQKLLEQIILNQNYNNYIIEEKNRENSLQYCCDSDFEKQSGHETLASTSKVSNQNGNLSSGSDSSLEMLYREIDAVDHDFNLNLSNGRKSSFINKPLNCGSEYFCNSLVSTSLTPG